MYSGIYFQCKPYSFSLCAYLSVSLSNRDTSTRASSPSKMPARIQWEVEQKVEAQLSNVLVDVDFVFKREDRGISDVPRKRSRIHEAREVLYVNHSKPFVHRSSCGLGSSNNLRYRVKNVV